MRKIIRWVYALILFVLVVLFGFAVETTADELGFVGVIRATIRGGFSDMVAAGYSEWLLAGILFFGGSWAALLIDGFLRKSAKLVITSEKRVHTVVKNKHFYNTTVPLDGFRYENCTFTGVTLKYNGGYTEIQGNEFLGGLVISSDVPEINTYVKVLGEFKLLAVPVISGDGTMKLGGVTKMPTVT